MAGLGIGRVEAWPTPTVEGVAWLLLLLRIRQGQDSSPGGDGSGQEDGQS